MSEPEQTVGQRLKIAIDGLGMKVGAFSRALGVSETNVRNYTERDSKPGTEFLQKLIVNFKQINLVWLLTGDGVPFHDQERVSAKFHKISGGTNTANHNSPTTINIGNITDLDSCKSRLEMAMTEIDSLRTRVDDLIALVESKNAVISTKDDFLNFLRGANNRPN